MDPILGQIILWPLAWIPQGWALCDGSLLNVVQNQALFSLLGATYGGDGRTNFALPDLRSRVPMGAHNVGAVASKEGAATAPVTGAASANLTIGVANLPAHTHTATFSTSTGSSSVDIAIPVNNATGDNNVPGTGLVLGKGTAGANPAKVYSSVAANATLKPFSVSVPAAGGTVANANTGGGQPLPVSLNMTGTVSTLQPSLSLNYIIAVQGIYPMRP